jgi:hypothetical protein
MMPSAVMNDSGFRRGLPVLAVAAACAAAAAGVVSFGVARPHAQSPALKLDIRGAKGQVVAPIYEGWYDLAGTRYALFGYYNRNLEEVVNVPVGAGNNIVPGSADQGQPTRFFPGRQFGVFAVAVPADTSKAEVTWTLAANGQTLSIPAIIDPLYFVSPQREDAGLYPGNTPPQIRFDASGPSGQGPLGVAISRSATVSHPLALDAWITDDGLPPAPGGRGAKPISPTATARPQGLTLAWSVYRGNDGVRFSNPAPAVEEGKARTTVTFAKPGNYVLRLLAMDSRSGTMCCWTNGYVRVAVDGQAADTQKTEDK